MYKETVNDSTEVLNKYYRVGFGQPWVWTGNTWTVTVPDNLKTLGHNTPHYHKRKQAGELLPFTSFLQVSNKGDKRNNVLEWWNSSTGDGYRYLGQGIDHDGDIVSWTSASSLGVDKYDPQVLVQSAAAKFGGDWDALTFAAETSRLISMFTGLITKVVRLIEMKPPGTPWATWLELRYGWRTLAYDIEDIERAINQRKPSQFAKRAAGTNVSWVASTDTPNVSGDGMVNQTYHNSTRWSLNGRAIIVTKGEIPRFKINILSTAWEVTRLSFVVDWFLTVGKFIESLQFATGIRAYVGGQGAQVEVESIHTRTIVPESGVTLGDCSYSCYTKALVQRREPANVPSYPLFSVNLDTWKVVDLLALLIQAIRR